MARIRNFAATKTAEMSAERICEQLKLGVLVLKKFIGCPLLISVLSGCFGTGLPESQTGTFEAFQVKADRHLAAGGCIDRGLKVADEIPRLNLVRDRQDQNGQTRRYTYYLDSSSDGVVAEVRYYPEASQDIGGLITRKFSAGNVSDPTAAHDLVREVFDRCVVPYQVN